MSKRSAQKKNHQLMIVRRLRHRFKYISEILGLPVRLVASRIKRHKPKRILLLTDMHCGSVVGLTPPSYQTGHVEYPETAEHFKRNKWSRLQAECWDWYIKHLNLIGPVHKTFVLGDCLDGDGKRSGGTELLTTDRKQQTAMAIECLSHVKTDRWLFVYGTPYHTGAAEDFETDISLHYNAKIGGHEWEEVNGVVFDLKHKQSNCKNPATSLFNEIVDNREWAVLKEQPKADVLIRAHTHRFCVMEQEDCMGISLPSLQAYGTKFGS